MELHLSSGIHACFELRMDASTVRSIRGSSHWLYMNCGSHYIYCFRLLGVDSGQICTLSTLNKRAWVCDADTLSGFVAEYLTIETLASFRSSLYLPSRGFDPLINKLLFSSLMIRWLRLSVLKTLLKRVLHVLRSTFLGQLLRIFLRRFMAYLGQSCLSRPRLSV